MTDRKAKLPPVPESKPGERPYYAEMYHKHAQLALESEEAMNAAKELIWACYTVYSLNKFEQHNFVENEKIQTVLQTPLVQLQHMEMWEGRAAAHKKFAELALPICETALYAFHRVFRGRTSLPEWLVQVENSPSFIARNQGIFVHVWKSHTQAKQFMAAHQITAQRISDLRIDTIFSPFTAMFVLHTVTVTATPLIPLVNDKPMNLVEAPVLSHVADQLEVYTRAFQPLTLHRGADGRCYAMETVGAILHNDGTGNGEQSPISRVVLFDYFPDIQTTSNILQEAMLRQSNIVVKELIENVNAKGEQFGGTVNLKIQDIVTDRIIPKTLHEWGFKIAFLYSLYIHRGMQGDGAGAVLREAIAAEMVCRTMKEILRGEVAVVPLLPNPDASLSTATAYLVDLLNRAVYNLLVRSEFWENHFLSVLRTKFRTPESFVIPHVQVTKRTVLTYLSMKLGTVFENGKFSKVNGLHNGSSMPKPCAVTKLVISNRRDEAHQQLLQNWKRVNDIKSTSLKICTMLHQVSLFAVARSQSLDWYINLMRQKLDELGDNIVNTVVLPIVIESAAELPDANSFRKLLGLYLSNRIKDIAKQHPLDLVVASEKYRNAAHQLSAIEKGHERDAVGENIVKAAHHILAIPDRHDRLTSTPFLEVLCEAMNYVYRLKDRHDEVETFFNSVKEAYTIDHRMDYLCEQYQKFSGHSLILSFPPSDEARNIFRSVADENVRLHFERYGESDQRYHVALMLSVCHWADVQKNELSEEHRAGMDKFRESTIHIHNALPSEQRPMLKGEWYLNQTAPVAEALMEHGQWKTARDVIAFGHNVLSEGHFKSSKGQFSTAALPGLKEVTRTLHLAILGTEKMQAFYRWRKMIREERERKEKLAAEEKARWLAERAKQVRHSLLLREHIIPSAKVCMDLASKEDVTIVPPLIAMHARRSHKGLHGLRLLAMAQPCKRFQNLSAIIIQSGLFPPFKWSISPFRPGIRTLAIIPDTECLGAWWNTHWLRKADFMDTQVPLFAKVAACYIHSQHKYSFLNWNLVGFSWCGAVAQCLTLLLPDTLVHAVVTFGSPPAFHAIDHLEPVPNAHVSHCWDLIPRLYGPSENDVLFQNRQRLLSRLDGIGAILPFPPKETMLGQLSEMKYLGSHMHSIEGDDSSITSKIEWKESNELVPIDLRTQLPNFVVAAYHALLIRASGKAVAVPPRWRVPQHLTLILEGLDHLGNPNDKLLQSFFVPAGVEPIAARPELLTLAYPKLAQSIAEGHVEIPEDYGLDVMPKVEILEGMEQCHDVGSLSDFIGAFLGATWDSLWCAHQLFELSGVSTCALPRRETMGGSRGLRERLRRQSSVSYGVNLSTDLLEAFVEKHNFLFTVAPEVAGGAVHRRRGGGTPVYIDGMTDKTRKLLAHADGYHLGWVVGVASTVRSTGKSMLINALVHQTLENSYITMTHHRNQRTVTIPSVRMQWKPKRPHRPNETKSSTLADAIPSHPLFLQMHFQEIRWDGKMAAQTLMRGAAQCIWLVSDMYTLEHLIATVDFSTRNILNVIVYSPRYAAEAPVLGKLKNFCLEHSVPFTVIDFERQESIEGLQRLLVYWMIPSFRFPINPVMLPPNVEVGLLYSASEEEVTKYVERTVKPTFGSAYPVGTWESAIDALQKAENATEQNMNETISRFANGEDAPSSEAHKEKESKSKESNAKRNDAPTKNEKDHPLNSIRAAAKAAAKEYESEKKK